MMYVSIPSALSCVLSRLVLLGMFLLSTMNASLGLAQEVAPPAAPRALSDVAANEDESLPLTDAQQAAKQLAATLERERPAGAASPSGPVAVPLFEPGPRYKPFMIKIYTSDRAEVVVMGGRATLVSPVNSVDVDDADARRPTLLRAEDGVVAIGVFVE